MKKRRVFPILAGLGAAVAYVSYRVKKEVDKEALNLDEGLVKETKEQQVQETTTSKPSEDDSDVEDQTYSNLTKDSIDLVKQTSINAIEELAQQGDIGEIERPIQQMVSFANIEDEQAFRQEAMSKSYVVSKGETPLEVIVLHISAIDKSKLFPKVLEIADLAKKYHGTYNGWKSKIVKK